MPGTTVAVGLRVGQTFIGDPVPRRSDGIAAFFVRQNGADEDIGGSDGIDPAGILRADRRVTAVIAYRSSGSFIELEAAKFEDYLRQEGLESILALRTKRGEHDKPGRERYFRYAKALLAGEQPSAAVTMPLGFAYEIVPDDDPTARQTPLRGRVLYDGKPLNGALVVAMLRGDPSIRLSARSDARGTFTFFTFALPRAGIWLIKSVHMVRAGFFSDADWYSLWASLIFATPEPRP